MKMIDFVDKMVKFVTNINKTNANTFRRRRPLSENSR